MAEDDLAEAVVRRLIIEVLRKNADEDPLSQHLVSKLSHRRLLSVARGADYT